MSTFLQIRTRASVRFGDPAFAIITDATWKEYVNDAERDVHAASPWWPWKETRTTSLSATTTGLVTLPTDAWRVNSVYNTTDDYPLSPIDSRAGYLPYFSQAASALGQPTNYRLRSNVIEVLPHPQVTTALAVEYQASPALMVADGDLPVFPAIYHQILVSGALARAYEDDGNTGQAQLHWAKFTTLLEQMKDEMLVTRGESYHAIGDDW